MNIEIEVTDDCNVCCPRYQQKEKPISSLHTLNLIIADDCELLLARDSDGRHAITASK